MMRQPPHFHAPQQLALEVQPIPGPENIDPWAEIESSYRIAGIKDSQLKYARAVAAGPQEAVGNRGCAQIIAEGKVPFRAPAARSEDHSGFTAVAPKPPPNAGDPSAPASSSSPM